MSKQFFSRLSQNYIEILNGDDITIEVGEDPNVRIFRAHMIILCYRSPFLRRTLTSNKKNNNDGVLGSWLTLNYQLSHQKSFRLFLSKLYLQLYSYLKYFYIYHK